MAEDEPVSELHEAKAVLRREGLEARREQDLLPCLCRAHVLWPRKRMRASPTDDFVRQNAAGQRTENGSASAGGLSDPDDVSVILVDGELGRLWMARRRVE